MENKRFVDWKKLYKSFGYAMEGIKEMLVTQQNARIHVCIAILVIVFGFIFDLNMTEWCIVMACIGLVMSAEAFNTVVEYLVDHLFPEQNPLAKSIKDIAAGAVFLLALFSVICGLIIFLPKLFFNQIQ